MWRYILRSLIDFHVRRRFAGLRLIHLGVYLAVLTVAGFAISLIIPTATGPVVFALSTADGAPAVLTSILFGVALCLIAAGWLVFRKEFARLDRKKVLVLEVRGMTGWNGKALADSLPRTYDGQKAPIPVDLRKGGPEGEVEPRAAMAELKSAVAQFRRTETFVERADVVRVAGSISPVPLNFLLGVLLDDEQDIDLFDWDRHRKMWRPLDADDDEQRFETIGLEVIKPGTRRVGLGVSASYLLDRGRIASDFPDLPLVELRLPTISTDNHWSEDKQCALGRQFLETVMVLEAQGVEQIELFLVASNSLSVRLGCLYDRRNLPTISVHQFQRGAEPAHPWAIRMPVNGLKDPELVFLTPYSR